jgi:dehydrogenase/reductase SDR family protein 7B
VPTHIPVVLPMDVGELNELPQRVESILAIHGQIDIFISNAGISCRCSAEECAMDVDIKLMLINYLGHVALTKGRMMSFKCSGQFKFIFNLQELRFSDSI